MICCRAFLLLVPISIRVSVTANLLLAYTGEAQQIDRIMDKFAERYCRDNPAAFAAADGAYLLAFALIMLNTDAHNPMADAHMAKADFVGMCQVQQVRRQTLNPEIPRFTF